VRRPLLLLLLVLAVAGAMRLWQLETLPPGLYHDEAYNGLDALALLRGETFPRFHEGWELYAADAHAGAPPAPTRWPVFFEGNYGREPLHIYLMALSIAVFGATPFAIRLVPAVAGVLAVTTTYLAAGALLPRRWSPRAPLAAAFALAVFFPALHFSRFGIRAMLFLPLATLCVHAFWRAYAHEAARGRTWYLWWAAAGFWLGLSLYTYAAARLFPLLFALFVPAWLGRSRPRWQATFPGIALMATVSLATSAPLLLFFIRYPYYFTFRIAYVASRGRGVVEGKPWLTWLYNSGRVVRGLLWHGEEHLRHNLPGRPFLDPVQAGLVIAGAVAVVRAARRRLASDDGLRALFLGLWLLVMLLPSILSGDAPHFGRLSGAAPPLAILAGAGVELVRRRLAGRVQPVAVHLLLLGLLAASAAMTIRDYFGRYAQHPGLAAAFYLDDWRLGKYAAEQIPAYDVYLTPTQEEMATLYFAVGEPDELHSFSRVGGALPLGRTGRPPLYLLRQPSEDALEQLLARIPQAERLETGTAAVAVRSAGPIDGARPTGTWAGAIALQSWEVDAAADVLLVRLRWQALANLERDYIVFVHLVDEGGEIVTQVDRPPAGYPTSDWRRNELIEDTLALALPRDLASGSYQIRTGFYFLPTQEPLGQPLLLAKPLLLP
jgi:4-amino-4-deoxy-L-arabinose transferase-like glycosyltransferase